jgi:hypothetical protein
VNTRERPATKSTLRVLFVALLLVAVATLLAVVVTSALGPGRTARSSGDGGAVAGFPVSDRKAASFGDCLDDAGIPATVGPGGGLQMANLDGLSMSRNADGSMSRLVIDGTDYAEAYNGCLAQFPDGGVDPDKADELEKELRRQLDDLLADPWPSWDTAETDEAAGAWVACARENGFSSAPEPRRGVVTVPGDLSVEAARQVAEACPLAEYGRFGFGVSSEQGLPADGVLEALTGGDLRLETNRDRQDDAVLST